MPKAVMVVYADPSDPSREDEFNTWYDSTHAPDVLKNVPGFKVCTRYKVAAAQLGPVETPGQYLAIYEIEVDDLSTLPSSMIDAHMAGTIPTTDVIAPGPVVFFEQVSDEITA